MFLCFNSVSTLLHGRWPSASIIILSSHFSFLIWALACLGRERTLITFASIIFLSLFLWAISSSLSLSPVVLLWSVPGPGRQFLRYSWKPAVIVIRKLSLFGDLLSLGDLLSFGAPSLLESPRLSCTLPGITSSLSSHPVPLYVCM